MLFYLTNLGEDWMLLGFPWLTAFNPKINWTEGTMENLSLCITFKAAPLRNPNLPLREEAGDDNPLLTMKKKNRSSWYLSNAKQSIKLPFLPT